MTFSRDSKALIITHYYRRPILGGEPAQDIRNFLLSKIRTIVYIENPFPFADDKRSFMTTYENGVIKSERSTFKFFGPSVFFYILSVIFTAYLVITSRKRFDICIALDNLNTFSVILLRKLNIIRKLVFYTIDYNPVRFKNYLLNKAYHLIDRIACYNCDKIWVLSKRMIIARANAGIDQRRSAASLILPMWADLSRIKILPITKINKKNLIFLGHLRESKGVQLVLDSMPEIIKKVPEVKFIVIGGGKSRNDLKRQAKRLGIANYVEFKGFLKDQEDVEKLLCESAIGVAPYVPDERNYAYFTDPGKPKLYLGCGLPVIITKVPEIAEVIQKKKAGFAISYSTKEFSNKALLLLTKNNLYSEYRSNAIKLSKSYDTNNLINNAFAKT